MFNDNKPVKYIVLAVLMIIIVIGILAFFGMQAQARGKFLPIREVTTDKGVTFWLVEDNTLPIMAMKFQFVDSGTALDPAEKQGLVRLLSNTMDEGAGEMTSQQFQKALSDHSIALSFNAGRDGFGGELVSLTRHRDKAFDLLSNALNAPRFDDEPVERMRNANLLRIRSSLSDPEWMAARLINDRAFEGHDYGKNSGGTISGLASVNPGDLREFQKQYLTRDRLLVTVAGNIDAQAASHAVDKVFAPLPARADAQPTADTVIANAGKIYLYEQDIPQTVIEIMLPSFDRDDPDYYALKVLNYIFGGAGFGSRLMEEAREKRGLTYGIYSSLADYRHTDTFNISTSTKNESAGEMLEIIKAEMLRLQNEKVAESELADAKSYLTGSMPLSLTSTNQIASVVLGLQVEELPIDYLDHFAQRIESVTADDIQRVARRVLKPESMVTALVGKPQNVHATDKIDTLPNVQ